MPRTEAGRALLEVTTTMSEAIAAEWNTVHEDETPEALLAAICKVEAEAAIPDEDDLARAILAARSTTKDWKGSARATEPTRWDRLMAKRVLAVLHAS